MTSTDYKEVEEALDTLAKTGAIEGAVHETALKVVRSLEALPPPKLWCHGHDYVVLQWEDAAHAVTVYLTVAEDYVDCMAPTREETKDRRKPAFK
jgi:hypothetical protein